MRTRKKLPVLFFTFFVAIFLGGCDRSIVHKPKSFEQVAYEQKITADTLKFANDFKSFNALAWGSKQYDAGDFSVMYAARADCASPDAGDVLAAMGVQPQDKNDKPDQKQDQTSAEQKSGSSPIKYDESECKKVTDVVTDFLSAVLTCSKDDYKFMRVCNNMRRENAYANFVFYHQTAKKYADDSALKLSQQVSKRGVSAQKSSIKGINAEKIETHFKRFVPESDVHAAANAIVKTFVWGENSQDKGDVVAWAQSKSSEDYAPPAIGEPVEISRSNFLFFYPDTNNKFLDGQIKILGRGFVGESKISNSILNPFKISYGKIMWGAFAGLVVMAFLFVAVHLWERRNGSPQNKARRGVQQTSFVKETPEVIVAADKVPDGDASFFVTIKRFLDRAQAWADKK